MPLALQINIIGDTNRCGPGCPAFIAKWSAWCENYNGSSMAVVKIDDRYRASLKRKSRSMIKESQNRGFTYRIFNYNNHLQDIYEINTSKEYRQERRMADSYWEYPTAISAEPAGDRCNAHQYIRIGGFRDDKLLAYAAIAVVNEFAVINSILGHAEALPDGIMNGLVDAIVRILWDSTFPARYLNYLTMQSATEGLQTFKRNVGFCSRRIEFIK